MDIKKTVRDFMLKELKDTGFDETVSDSESLINLNILDSLSILKLISFLDEEYNIYLSEDELKPEKFDTVDHIADFISIKLES